MIDDLSNLRRKKALPVSRRWLLFVVTLVSAIGPGLISSAAEGSKMEVIAVAPEDGGFVERDSGRPYIPFGTNYYDPHTGWAPKLWKQFDAEKVREHFRVMRELGVNCARVFLTAGSFQPDAERVEEGALKKLDALVEIAREANIRLMPTGPDHWEGSPSYWRPDRFAGDEALKALERFWEVVGKRYRGEPAIFAWDLLNEPHVPWFVEQWRQKWNVWLQERYGSWESLKTSWSDELGEAEKWGQVGVPENKAEKGSRRLRDWQEFREHLADVWVRRQVEALRRADPTHLITVGYIQWSYPLVRPGDPGRYAAFNPRRQAQLLDFLTIHFYPTMGSPFGSEDNRQKNLDYLQAVLAYCHVGKPVVLGEFGWYGGGAPQQHPYLSEEQQADWIGAEIEASRWLADGWLSWPFADTPSSRDISLYAGLVKEDLTVKAWGRKFKALAANLPELAGPKVKLTAYDFTNALTPDQEDLQRMHQAYVEAIQREPRVKRGAKY
jgi:endo-1,4-beta-mannosidase